jgi:hypothetical protein
LEISDPEIVIDRKTKLDGSIVLILTGAAAKRANVTIRVYNSGPLKHLSLNIVSTGTVNIIYTTTTPNGCFAPDISLHNLIVSAGRVNITTKDNGVRAVIRNTIVSAKTMVSIATAGLGTNVCYHINSPKLRIYIRSPYLPTVVSTGDVSIAGSSCIDLESIRKKVSARVIDLTGVEVYRKGQCLNFGDTNTYKGLPDGDFESFSVDRGTVIYDTSRNVVVVLCNPLILKEGVIVVGVPDLLEICKRIKHSCRTWAIRVKSTSGEDLNDFVTANGDLREITAILRGGAEYAQGLIN